MARQPLGERLPAQHLRRLARTHARSRKQQWRVGFTAVKRM